jgi:hypothetical protein
MILGTTNKELQRKGYDLFLCIVYYLASRTNKGQLNK